MTDDEVCDTLVHLKQLGLMRFSLDDEAGALYFQARTDQAATLAALLDDHGRTCRN